MMLLFAYVFLVVFLILAALGLGGGVLLVVAWIYDRRTAAGWRNAKQQQRRAYQ